MSMILPSNNQFFHPTYLEDNTVGNFFNDLCIDFPENLGKELADTWLQLADNHEKHTLNKDPIFVQNIISKIKDMSPEKLKVSDQNFLQRIASFSESERRSLVNFFVDTLHSDLEKCWFHLFCELTNTLNSVQDAVDNEVNHQKIVNQILTDVFGKTETAYNLKLNNAISQLPFEVLNQILDRNFRRSEVCTFFKIKEIWNNMKVSDVIHTQNVEYELNDDFKVLSERNILQLHSNHASSEIPLENIKDAALDYLNLYGKVPNHFNLDGKRLFTRKGLTYPCEEMVSIYQFLIWLGPERTKEIKKLNITRTELTRQPISDLFFICPNLEELEFGYNLKEFSENNFDKIKRLMHEDFASIPQCKNLKVLKLSNFCLDNLSFLLEQMSSVETLKSLELNYSNFDRIIPKASIFAFDNLSVNKNIEKLTINNLNKEACSSDTILCEITEKILSKFENVNELNLCNSDFNVIEYIAKSKPSHLKVFNFSDPHGYHFTSEISSLNESQRSCLINFFINTSDPAIKYYWFSLFEQLISELNSVNLDDTLNENDAIHPEKFNQVLTDKFSEIKTSYDKKFMQTFSNIPREIFDQIFEKYPRKTEIRKQLKIDKVWESIKDTNPFINGRVVLTANADFFRSQNTDPNKTFALQAIKDQALNHINFYGKMPIIKLDQKEITSISEFLNWLGPERTNAIKKICITTTELKKHKLSDIYFICPNLEEVELDYNMVNFSKSNLKELKKSMKEDVESISLIKNIKILKLSNVTFDILNVFFQKISGLEKLETLELDYSFNFGHDLDQIRLDNVYEQRLYEEHKQENYLSSFDNLPINKNIKNVTIKNVNHIFNDNTYYVNFLQEISGKILSKLINVDELNISHFRNGIIKNLVKADMNHLKKINFSYYEGDDWREIQNLKQITHVSYSNSSQRKGYIPNPSIYTKFAFPPSLKHMYVDGTDVKDKIERALTPVPLSRTIGALSFFFGSQLLAGTIGSVAVSELYDLIRPPRVRVTPPILGLSATLGLISGVAMTTLLIYKAYGEWKERQNRKIKNKTNKLEQKI